MFAFFVCCLAVLTSEVESAEIREFPVSPSGYLSSGGYIVGNRDFFVSAEKANPNYLQVAVKAKTETPQSKPVRVVPVEDSDRNQNTKPSSTPRSPLHSNSGAEHKNLPGNSFPGGKTDTVTLRYTVMFGLDQHTLAKGGNEDLDNFAETIKGASEVKVTGYTCDLGGKQHNDALAMRRARQVSRYLVSLGVPAEIIKTNGLGKCCYVSPDFEANRRAEVEGLIQSSTKNHLSDARENQEALK